MSLPQLCRRAVSTPLKRVILSAMLAGMMALPALADYEGCIANSFPEDTMCIYDGYTLFMGQTAPCGFGDYVGDAFCGPTSNGFSTQCDGDYPSGITCNN